MRQITVHRPGGYHRLKIENLPDPEPGPGEVVVETRAIGVNYADCIVRMGWYSSAKEYVGWPIVPGFEAAGRVIKVGTEVSDLVAGESVLVLTRFGGYSTHIVVPRHQVFRLPGTVSPVEGAAFSAIYLTAWYALVHLCQPRKGERVLIHSAAGGVGGALLQLARLHRLESVGVVGRSHKVPTARRGGAHHVIDKSSERLWARAGEVAPDGYDIILDANGVSTLKQSYRHLAPTGRLVVYGFASMMPKRGGWANPLKLLWGWLRTPRFDPLRMTMENKSVLAFNLSYLFERQDLLQEGMGELLSQLESGRITPPNVTTYGFKQVEAAHRAIESGRTVGKLVLIP